MNIFSLFAGAMPFLAQTPAPPDLPRTKSILDTLIAAGPVMYALLAMSIILVMLVVTYFLTIRRGAVVSSGLMATADALLRKRDYLGLLAVSNRHGEAIARVVQKVLDFTTKNPSADFAQGTERGQS
jgi:biopolymer transport protein ExbB